MLKILFIYLERKEVEINRRPELQDPLCQPLKHASLSAKPGAWTGLRGMGGSIGLSDKLA